VSRMQFGSGEIRAEPNIPFVSLAAPNGETNQTTRFRLALKPSAKT